MRSSIIVPVYNKKDYLGECLESVLTQALSDCEMILVDDGSTDGSGAVCDEYAKRDERISVIHKPNEGPSAARNTGVERAKGDYLIFLDCDDMLAEGFLAAVENTVLANDAPDLVVCCIDRFREDSGNRTPYDGVDGLPESGSGDELAAHIEKKHNRFGISHCRYAIGRGFYNNAGLSFRAGLNQEDELFTPLLVCAADTYAVCKDAHYLYRMVEGSRNNTPSIENKLSFFTIAEELLKKSKEALSEPKRAMLDKRGKFMFRRGLLEHNELLKDGRKKLVNAAARVYRRYPEAAEDSRRLVGLIKLLGPKLGISAFLRLSAFLSKA